MQHNPGLFLLGSLEERWYRYKPVKDPGLGCFLLLMKSGGFLGWSQSAAPVPTLMLSCCGEICLTKARSTNLANLGMQLNGRDMPQTATGKYPREVTDCLVQISQPSRWRERLPSQRGESTRGPGEVHAVSSSVVSFLRRSTGPGCGTAIATSPCWKCIARDGPDTAGTLL